MTTAEKLAKLNKQLAMARAMISASDPRAGDAENRAAAALIVRITGDMGLGRHSTAASAASELHRVIISMQKAWASGDSSATGRVLTQVETLAAEIEAELKQKAAGG